MFYLFRFRFWEALGRSSPFTEKIQLAVTLIARLSVGVTEAELTKQRLLCARNLPTVSREHGFHWSPSASMHAAFTHKADSSPTGQPLR